MTSSPFSNPATNPRPDPLTKRWVRWLLLPVLALSLAASGYFAMKTWRTYQVLSTARALDIPETGTIRGWMTLGYVAQSFAVEAPALARELDVPDGTPPTATLRALAEREGLSPLVYVQRVQRALARLDAGQGAKAPRQDASWFATLAEDSLSALLVYGYPALVVVLFLGALGVPVPAGPLTTVAGTLALQGEVDGAFTVALAVGVSVVGDVTGYAIGRLVSPAALERWGPWLGYTRKNRRRVERLFARWGGLTLILTRSLVAYVGVVASILAGTARYRLDLFTAYSVVGRVLWTGAYFGVGYVVGTNFEAASGLLGYVSLLALSLAVAAGAIALWTHHRRAVRRALS